MGQIQIGTKGEFNLLVTGEVAIDFMGNETARVLSTPHLIGYLELTCRNAVQNLLDTGYDTVGTHVDIKHLAATPIGLHVRFLAEVIAVEDRRILFRVEASDEKEKVAEGTHERFVVNVARFGERVQAKRAG
jgi:fluoroacetyl-CoA thioesterase